MCSVYINKIYAALLRFRLCTTFIILLKMLTTNSAPYERAMMLLVMTMTGGLGSATRAAALLFDFVHIFDFGISFVY